MKIRSAALLLAVSLAPLPAAAQPLSPRGEENLVALTRLLGYVRYFHPSDQAAAADWSRLAVAGAKAAEPAATPAELARALEETFRPVAPTVRVFPTGAKPDLPDALRKPAGEIVAWEHHGLATDMPSMFRSERVVRPGAEPSKPFLVDLGGGVSALVPLALYRDAQGTLPHAAAPEPKPDGAPLSGNDRAVRLAAVALAWNGPQHFYPYFDNVKTDWPAVLRGTLKSAATDADERAFFLTLRRLMVALQDGHAGVMHKTWPLMSRLPVQWEWIENQLVVTHAAPEVPGIRRGDVVLRLDGRLVDEVVREREALVSGTTPQGRRAFTVFELTLGEKDSEVRLDVRHPSGETATVALRRTHPSFGPGSLPQPRPEPIAELRPGVFYVDAERITDDDFKAALDRFASAKAILFDYRGHPNAFSPENLAHFTDRPMATPPSFTPVVTRPDREAIAWEPVQSTIQPKTPRLRARTVFLADARSISAAELHLALAEAHQLGDIVGSPTAGTNGNAVFFKLPGGYMALWTQLKVNRHDGSPLQGAGIRPTVPAAPTLRGVGEGRDEVQERALALAGND